MILPGTLVLVYLALPLWDARWLPIAVVVLALVALVVLAAGFGLAANFAKMWAAVFAGWAFLRLFERLSWVVLVALVIPLVDIISVYKGPTHTITQHHFEVYTAVAIAFLVPGGGAAYLGPPDMLFYALFLAAAARWSLRVRVDVDRDDVMYGADRRHRDAPQRSADLPALPFLSFGFLVRERRPALARYPPVGGFVGLVVAFFFGRWPGCVLTAVSPSENGDRNDAITERTIAVETANQPAAES